MIAAQPREYAAAVARDLRHFVSPGRVQRRGDARLVNWRFFTGPQPAYTSDLTPVGFEFVISRPRLDVPKAALLSAYQDRVFMPGTLLAAGWVAALAAAAWPRGPARLRLDRLLLAAVGAVLVVLPALTVAFDYRFLLPQLVVLPVAAALASRRLLPAGRPDLAAARRPTAPYPAGG